MRDDVGLHIHSRPFTFMFTLHSFLHSRGADPHGETVNALTARQESVGTLPREVASAPRFPEVF
jgi:hypothetical protein